MALATLYLCSATLISLTRGSVELHSPATTNAVWSHIRPRRALDQTVSPPAPDNCQLESHDGDRNVGSAAAKALKPPTRCSDAAVHLVARSRRMAAIPFIPRSSYPQLPVVSSAFIGQTCELVAGQIWKTKSIALDDSDPLVMS